MPAPYRPKIYKRQTEESLQRRICNYIKANYPGVIYFSDASGVKMSDTKRISMHAMKTKDFRVPDIIIDYPVTHTVKDKNNRIKKITYHGARLEVKPEGTAIYKKDGTLRKDTYIRRFKNGSIKRGDHLAEQAHSLRMYNEAGYFARFAVGYDNAIKLIDWYMDKPQNLELF